MWKVLNKNTGESNHLKLSFCIRSISIPFTSTLIPFPSSFGLVNIFSCWNISWIKHLSKPPYCPSIPLLYQKTYYANDRFKSCFLIRLQTPWRQGQSNIYFVSLAPSSTNREVLKTILEEVMSFALYKSTPINVNLIVQKNPLLWSREIRFMFLPVTNLSLTLKVLTIMGWASFSLLWNESCCHKPEV